MYLAVPEFGRQGGAALARCGLFYFSYIAPHTGSLVVFFLEFFGGPCGQEKSRNPSTGGTSPAIGPRPRRHASQIRQVGVRAGAGKYRERCSIFSRFLRRPQRMQEAQTAPGPPLRHHVAQVRGILWAHVPQLAARRCAAPGAPYRLPPPTRNSKYVGIL